MSQINVRSFSNENEDGAPDIVGVTTFSATSYFVPSKGTTAQIPSDHVEVGSLRFNTDTSNLEYYRGDTLGWSQFELIDPDLGGGTGSNIGLGTRAIAFGGNNGSPYDDIEFFTISTLGNAQDFGNCSTTKTAAGAAASRTRAIVVGGQEPGNIVGEIDFVTIASTGNTTDFGGDLTDSRDFTAGLSDQTRGVFAGGRITAPNTAGNVIDYITMASGGNAIDFGDTRSTTLYYPMCLASSTRGIIASGQDGSSESEIDFITIKTTGNAAEFGTLSSNFGGVGASNSTRGIFAGGYSPGVSNVISFITIATTGNSADFGDLTRTTRSQGSASSPLRACFIGGKTPSNSNVIDFITIATTGDASDFGDLTGSNSGQKGNVAGCSNGHGGL